MLMLGSRARCLGFPTVINTLATRLVMFGESHSALETWLGASYG
jgi:hypothetical protein